MTIPYIILAYIVTYLCSSLGELPQCFTLSFIIYSLQSPIFYLNPDTLVFLSFLLPGTHKWPYLDLILAYSPSYYAV